MRASRVVCYLLLLFCFSCKEQGKNGLIKYVEATADGLTKNVEAGEWLYSVQYKPAEYILLQEHNDKKDSATAFRKKQLEGTAWFNIVIKRKDGTAGPLRHQTASHEEYELKYNYYLNEASKHIYLLYGKDSLAPLSYLFETNYNIAPQETIVVGFLLPDGNEKPKEEMQLVFKDGLLRTGIIKAFFDKESLLNIPQ